jgi:hypothetical protein
MRQWTAMAGVALLALAAGTAAEVKAGAEDDLAVVKKAVASPVAAAHAPAVRSGREPQWFKVRVVDKATGHKKVTVNLPLSLVRVLGDETIDWGCHDDGKPVHAGGDKCHSVRLADVLRTLEAGQELVEVDDDDSTVKVWVE